MTSQNGEDTCRFKMAVDEKREVWKKIETIRDRGEQPSVAMKHLYGRKKKAARRALDKARQKMEEELYKKLDEDGGKRMIYKMTLVLVLYLIPTIFIDT